MLKLLIFAVTLFAVSTVARSAVQTHDIRYNADDQTYQGYYAYDDQFDTKRPAVLVFPEWWGITDYTRSRARQLAELGYAAMVVDVYGDAKVTDSPETAGQLSGALKKNPQHLSNISRAAMEALQQQPQVDPEQLAATGYCFGGYAALELARQGADLMAVVTFHGDLSTANPDGAKHIKAKILILNGGDDPYVTAADLEHFKQSMRQAHVDWQLISYGGAIHSFSNPQSDQHHLDGIGYNKLADQRSWAAMKSFLEEVFGK